MRKTKVKRQELLAMTDKSRRFAYEYVIDYNQTQAAIRAGYAKKTAGLMGGKLKKRKDVAKLIGQLEAEALKKRGLERDNVLLKLSQNLNRNIWDLGDEQGVVVSSLRDIPPQAHPYIDGFEVKQRLDPETGDVVEQTIKIKLAPNAAAQDMAMKYIGAYAAEKKSISLERPALDYDALLERSDAQAIDVVSRRIEQEEQIE